MDLLTLVLISVVFFCLLLYFLKGNSYNTSPQKPGLPIFGNLFNSFPRHVSTLVDELSLGDVFHCKLGPVTVVRLNTHRAIHEAFVSQSDKFSARPRGAMITALSHDAGVLNNDGPVWQEHRRLMLRLLRDFGVGKPLVNEIVEDEAVCLINRLKAREGAPVVTQDEFSSLTSNVIARLIFGARYGTDDAGFKQFMENVNKSLEIRLSSILGFVFPFILKVPILSDIYKRNAVAIVSTNGYQEYVRGKIVNYQKMFEKMDPPLTEVDQASNLCEAFLIEKKNQEALHPGRHTFSDMQLIMNMSDLFLAGTETTASTMNWAMILLATHPDIQDRLHAEIKEKIGYERFPSPAQRQELPYVCAVMDEVMRYSSLVPLNASHRCTENTELLGYKIPADAVITSSIHGVHHDPKNWEKPEEFYPGHFLSKEGKYQPSKYLIPFSLGKRACLGESLARAEYFLLFVSILQNFQIKVADPKLDVKKTLTGRMKGIRHPGPHKIVFDKLVAE